MTEMTLLHGEIEAVDRTKAARRADNGWSLDKVVFVVVLGVAYACAAFAVALPIYVWLF